MGQYNEDWLEELHYWETKSVDELVKEIEDLYDFEQAPYALIALEEKAPERAVRMGADIIKYDRGDQFLQAGVFDCLFRGNEQAILQAVEERKAPVEWYLIGTMLPELIFFLQHQQTQVSKQALEKIVRSYELSDRKEEIDPSQWRAFLDCYHLSR
jgi:hypothetical protein